MDQRREATARVDDRAPGQATVRRAVFDLLRAFGMTTASGNPGSTELPMLKDFPDGFRYVLALQECVVLGMADGYAQATRNAAFVNGHKAARDSARFGALIRDRGIRAD